jgi:hypothetical protein
MYSFMTKIDSAILLSRESDKMGYLLKRLYIHNKDMNIIKLAICQIEYYKEPQDLEY